MAEMPGEVADDGLHLQALIAAGQHLCRIDECCLAHVEGHEALQLAGGPERVEQRAGLVARARAELDDRRGPRPPGDLARASSEDGAFGFGRVVLDQAGDLVEQLRPAVVVEPHRRQDFR